MNQKAFGDCIDIHGGGRDLIFPHHENEIAQTEALTGKPLANFWIHNGLIKVNGQKMSKSLGNSLLLKDLLDRYSPETIKFALLQTNYRGDINITDNLFPDAEKHLVEFYTIIKEVMDAGIKIEGKDEKIDAEFDECMDNDFNTALALSNLFVYFKNVKSRLAAKDQTVGASVNQIIKTYSLLGLFGTSPKVFLDKYKGEEKPEIPAEIITLAEKMQSARAVKNYAEADALRAEINAKGYNVLIGKDGYKIDKK